MKLASLSLADATPATPSAEEARVECCGVIELSVSEVNAATTEFAEARIIGEGGFGRVYIRSYFLSGRIVFPTSVVAKTRSEPFAMFQG